MVIVIKLPLDSMTWDGPWAPLSCNFNYTQLIAFYIFSISLHHTSATCFGNTDSFSVSFSKFPLLLKICSVLYIYNHWSCYTTSFQNMGAKRCHFYCICFLSGWTWRWCWKADSNLLNLSGLFHQSTNTTEGYLQCSLKLCHVIQLPNNVPMKETWRGLA